MKRSGDKRLTAPGAKDKVRQDVRVSARRVGRPAFRRVIAGGVDVGIEEQGVQEVHSGIPPIA